MDDPNHLPPMPPPCLKALGCFHRDWNLLDTNINPIYPTLRKGKKGHKLPETYIVYTLVMHTSLSSVSILKQSHPNIRQRVVLSFSRQSMQKFRENNAEKLEWKGNLNLETLTDLKKISHWEAISTAFRIKIWTQQSEVT